MAAVHPTNLLCSLSPSVAFSVPLYHHLPIYFWAEPHQTSCSLLLQSQKFTAAQLYSFVTAPLTEALSYVSDIAGANKNTTKHLTCPLTLTHTPQHSQSRQSSTEYISHLIFSFLFSTISEPWKVENLFFSLVLSVEEQERESDRFSMRAS